MGRPYRPHPMKKPDRDAGKDAWARWRAAHPKQETAAERKARKRAEAEHRAGRAPQAA